MAILDGNGNAFDTTDVTPAANDAAAPAPAAEGETAETTAEVPSDNPLDPIFRAMHSFQTVLNRKEDTPEVRDVLRAHLGDALDAFAAVRAFKKIRRGRDYTIDFRDGAPGRPVNVVMQDHTRAGGDFVAAWAAFMRDMDAEAKEGETRAILGMFQGKIMAQDSVINQLLLRVAALENKVK